MKRLHILTAILATSVPAAALAQAGGTSVASATVIYKHVDENGRVTYANSPIKGGARVELEPLTVIPSNPGGGSAAPLPVVKLTPPATTPAAQPAVPVAVVTPVSSQQAAKAEAKPVEQKAPDARPAEVKVASVADNLQLITQQRRLEARKRMLESEIRNEEDLLTAARNALGEEQKLSGGIRAMRANFSASADGATAQRPVMSADTKAEIERHFERVRNLQDQVAMHETHLQELRGQLTSLK